MTRLTEPLGWDSTFFGLSVGRVLPGVDDYAAAAMEADAHGYACTYLLIDSAHGARLIDAQGAGFTVVGTRVEFATSTLQGDGGIIRTRPADPDADRDWIVRMAESRFGRTRFSVDPLLAPHAGRMYAEWARGALDDRTKQVLALDTDGGFVVCASAEDPVEGVIELIATAESYRGGGGQLIRGAHAWFRARQLNQASVVTQGDNVPALRLYESSGYRVRAAGTWLHRWKAGFRRLNPHETLP